MASDGLANRDGRKTSLIPPTLSPAEDAEDEDEEDDKLELRKNLARG